MPESNMPGLSDLAGWLIHLENLHPAGQAGIELGLDRVRQVKSRLGQVQTCPLIIVGGTNGKGSTCAYLEAILRFSGYRVGCYTSPHLLDYRERVRINGEWVGDAALCNAFVRVETARRTENTALTYFEFGTLAAWEVFAVASLDVIILEVGLGGRLDAVNIYDADCAAVTVVDLDHTAWLGDTREAIAFEKAGIYRPDRPAFCADIHPPQSLLQHAAAIGADLRLIGRDFGYQGVNGDKTQWTFWAGGDEATRIRRGGLAAPGLRGHVQFANAALALAMLDSLKDRLPLSMQAIRQGLLEPGLIGRFQIIPGQPAIVLDVAHNPQAMRVLAGNLADMGFYPRTLAVVGMLADKDIKASLTALAGRIDAWYFAPLDSSRSAPAQFLAEVVVDARLGGTVSCHESLAEALNCAKNAANESDRIAIFGSFFTVAGALKALDRVR